VNSDAGLYARSFFDVYDDWYGELDDPAALVHAFKSRCPAGAVIVEMGSGSGRLATPLHAGGFVVLCVDVSHELLQTAPLGPYAVTADMAAIPLSSGCADAVLVAYNTLFNLASRHQQQQCFHEAARILRPGGLLAIEAFIADGDDALPFGVSTQAHPRDPDAHLVIVTGPDEHDPEVIVGSHIEIGRSTTCRPWRLTYQSPAALDACADTANLVLRHRHNDWGGTAFGPASLRHVSWYERI
jgi:SAM-dependent methyltransferase